MHKEITKEFLNFGLLKVVYFSNNHDLNHTGHLFLHFFPWFQLNIENCHPGWLSNLCLIWMWRFRPTFKNLILHHLEISRGPPLVISSSWKFTGDSTAPTPGIFQDLKIFRAWKFPWAVNEVVLKKLEFAEKFHLGPMTALNYEKWKLWLLTKSQSWIWPSLKQHKTQWQWKKILNILKMGANLKILKKKTDKVIKLNKCNQCDYASWTGHFRTHLKVHSGVKQMQPMWLCLFSGR